MPSVLPPTEADADHAVAHGEEILEGEVALDQRRDRRSGARAAPSARGAASPS
ncbi:MAG: hypothetical protein MZV64_06580 [Ignavibacteriales bacterium]|nr:hypothetical protein [Ignavibacteriales bacterium]